MSGSARTPELQANTCASLDEMLFIQPWMQEPIYIQGGHKEAIKAMRSFATHADVQIQCSNLLGNMVQWNWVLARALADDSALDAMELGLQNFPDHPSVHTVTGQMGAFTDFDMQNRKHLVELGIVGQVYNITDTHYTTNDVAQMYNLLATLCHVPEAADEMEK